MAGSSRDGSLLMAGSSTDVIVSKAGSSKMNPGAIIGQAEQEWKAMPSVVANIAAFGQNPPEVQEMATLPWLKWLAKRTCKRTSPIEAAFSKILCLSPAPQFLKIHILFLISIFDS